MDHGAPVPNDGRVRVDSGVPPAIASAPTLEPPHRRRSRRGPRWFIWLIGCLLTALLLVLLACALVGGLVMGIAFKLANEVTATATATQSFVVTDTPSLDIHNASGRMQVQPGAPGNVTVQMTKTARDASLNAARADLDNITVNATQTGDQITISTSLQDEGFFAGSSSVNLLITVPPNANITADVPAGDIQISGVSGQMELTGGAGDVTLQGMTLSDGSRIHVATGSVTFQGTIAPNATVDLSVSTGDVTLQLPADTVAQLDARTNIGNIHISGWSLQPTRINNVGTAANGLLGPQGQAAGTIHVRVDTGDITVSQV